MGRAYTLVECMAIMVLASLGLAVWPPSCLQSTTKKREVTCTSNLRQLGIASINYATDFKDRLPGYTWRAGHKEPNAGDLAGASDDLQAVANQAVWILRQRADQPDMGPISGWLPNVGYTHLIINDYLQQRLPEPMMVCPEDAARMAVMPKKGKAWVAPVATRNEDRRWAYSSSYQVVPAAYSAGKASKGPAGVRPTISQGKTDDEYLVPKQNAFGKGTIMSMIAYPSQKVHVFDSHDRHGAKPPRFYASEGAKQPLLFFDTSVQTRLTADADVGFQPNDPANAAPTVFTYRPSGTGKDWNPAPMQADGDAGMKGYYRWTRGGLAGIDFHTGPAPAVKEAALPVPALDLFHRAAP